MKKVLTVLAALMLAATMNAQVIFSEDFNGSTSIPTGWSVIADSLENYSRFASYGQSWFITGFSEQYGNAALSISYTTTSAPCDRWLITPKIHIDQSGAIPYSLSFLSWGYTTGQYAEQLKVMISTTDSNKTSFTLLEDLGSIDAGFAPHLIDLGDYEGQDVFIAFVNYGDGYYVAVDNVEIKVPEQNGLQLAQLNLPTYAAINSNVNVSGYAVNTGAQPLTSFDVTYTDGTNPVATYHVSGINVPFNGYTSFTHDVPYNTANPGTVNFTVTISNPNGVPSETGDTVLSGSVQFYDPAATVARTVLLENFTTAQCPNCPSAHDRIHNALNGRNDVIWMAHHSGYYTDGMTCTEDEDYLWFYNDGGGTYAPAVMLDRNTANSSESYTPVFFPDSDVADYVQSASEAPAFVTVALGTTTEGNTVNIRVRGTFSSDVNCSSPRINVFLVEDSIYATQSGITGKMYHMGVMRKAITGTWGEALGCSTTAGSSYDKTYSYTVPSTNVLNHCKVIAFISNYNSNDPNDCAILNSAITPNYIDKTNLRINEVSESHFEVYPNPATNYVMVEATENIREIVLINSLGQQVYANSRIEGNQYQLNTSDLAAGLYMMTVRTAAGTSMQRLSIVR